MFNCLIKTLKDKKEELLSFSPKSDDAIVVENTPDYFKMVLKDYMEVGMYSDIIDNLDPDKISDKISFSVLWNTTKQRINKGTFYVISIDDKTYNIWFDGLDVKLDERIKVGEETHEKIIKVDMGSGNFHFTSLKHDKIGSTFYTMYYHPGEALIPAMSFSKEEALGEINKMLDNFLDIEISNSIVNIEEIRNIILRDLSPDGVKLEKKSD